MSLSLACLALLSAWADISRTVAKLTELPDAPPVVTISHQPWGEATFHSPIRPQAPIVPTAVHFIAADVAAVNATGTGYGNRSVPVFLLMKKVGAEWRVTSFHVLAP